MSIELPPESKPTSHTEMPNIPTKRLAEGASTGWEEKDVVTVEQVVTGIKQLFPNVKELVPTSQIVTHDGKLVSVDFDVPGAQFSFTYTMKGTHKKPSGTFNTRNAIFHHDFSPPDTRESPYTREMAEHKNGVWGK